MKNRKVYVESKIREFEHLMKYSLNYMYSNYYKLAIEELVEELKNSMPA